MFTIVMIHVLFTTMVQFYTILVGQFEFIDFE